MDYNGIVYNAYENIKKDIEKNDYTKDKIEELVLEEVVSCTKALICNVVKPKKLTWCYLTSECLACLAHNY